MNKNKKVALLLCIFGGYLGLHLFYTGKYAKGILYLFTAGLFYIGWWRDIYLIATNKFDAYFDLPKLKINDEAVFVSKHGSVYHCYDMCGNSYGEDWVMLKNEKEAIKRGYRKCKKCYSQSTVEEEREYNVTTPDDTRPATEEQIKYAKRLGIEIPKNATMYEVSKLITEELNK